MKGYWLDAPQLEWMMEDNERDRIACVAFAGSLNRTAGGKQNRRKVAKSQISMRTLTKPKRRPGVSRDDGVWRQSQIVN
jgi:hypothetical protein